MKNTLHHFLVIFALLFAVSCKKPEVITPDPVKPPEIEKPAVDKTETVTWDFDSFITDDHNVAQIFPGAIFSVKQNGNDLELVSLQNKYTPLPITASTSIIGGGNKDFIDIPSADKISAYTKTLNITNTSLSQRYSENEFKDYKVVKYFLSNNSDVKSVFDNIGITTSTRITKKHACYFFSNNERFSLDMNLPGKTELLSVADVDKLNTSDNPCYINSVVYGNNSLILAEADADFGALKTALKAAFAKQELTSAQTQILSTAKVTFYARGGSEKTFIKIAKTLEDIKAVAKEFDTFNSAAIAYPVSYSLRSVKDFKLFHQNVKIDIIL